MSEPILAPEEIEALMAEVAPDEEREAVFASLPPIKQPGSVTAYHFESGDEDSPERYPMFVNLQERMVEMLDEQWDELVSRDVSIQVDSLSNMLYKDIITSDNAHVYFVFECEGFGRILLSFDTALIVAFVDAMLGGDGEASGNPQSLSAVELRLSERIASKMSQTLSDLWEPVYPLAFTPYKLSDDPQFLAVTGAMEKCFSSFFDIKLSDDLKGQMSIHYPKPFLDPILDKLRVEISDDSNDTDTEWIQELNQSLADTPAALRFELGRCQVDIGSFLEMKPGDFLPFHARVNDPCSLWIDDIPLFKAKPGEQNGGLAAEIIETISTGGTS